MSCRLVDVGSHNTAEHAYWVHNPKYYAAIYSPKPQSETSIYETQPSRGGEHFNNLLQKHEGFHQQQTFE